jgi:hypothetical protein
LRSDAGSVSRQTPVSHLGTHTPSLAALGWSSIARISSGRILYSLTGGLRFRQIHAQNAFLDCRLHGT